MYKLLHGATYLGDANARAFRDMRVLEQQQLTDDPLADGGLETRCASSTADHSTRPICSSVTGIRLRRTACRADCVHDNPQPPGHMSRAFSRSDARRRSSRHRHRPRAWGALVHAALQAPRAWGACRPAGATRQRPCRVHTGVRTWRSSQSERERARKRGVSNCKGLTSVWGKNNGSGNSNVWGQGDEHEVGPVAQEECALGTQAALHDCRVE